MSDLIRLQKPLSVVVDGGLMSCPALSTEQLLVDADTALSGDLDVSVLCTATLTVRCKTRVSGLADGELRYLLDVLAWEGDGEDRLIAHVSSLRKDAHLNIVAHQDVEAAHTRAGWHKWRFPHCPMPEAHPDRLDLSTGLLGKTLAAPLMISGMTGGSERAGVINRRLATAAQELGVAMGLGSQRAMLEAPTLAKTFSVRDVAPDILLAANIGAVQLNHGVSNDDVRRLIDAVQADALAVHLNVLQEMVQPEGDRDWSGLVAKVESLIAAVDVPVILKETGSGMTGAFARTAVGMGASALDVGGTGGTSWGWIEGFRAADPHRQAIGATFRDWGVPTADSVRSCRAVLGGSGVDLIATGGVRTGLDAAKAIALGADVAGMALPFFRAADQGEEEAVGFGRRIIEEIRIAILCCGAKTPLNLRIAGLEPA
jgi:isopentenyl-diphosphate Delta-isomerase